MNPEYREFLEASASRPPRALSERVSGRVLSELRPAFARVFAKLVVVHAAAAAASFALCPQFGVGFGGGRLTAFLMRQHELVCAAGCGFVFLAGSLLLAALVLLPDEVRAVRRRRGAFVGALVTLSFLVFLGMGRTGVDAYAVFWAIGAAAGAALALETGWKVRDLAFRLRPAARPIS